MVGIISDIHGNYAALNAVLQCLDDMQVSSIVCLGDTGGYYCEVNECCEELQRRKILTLMGNHDWYLVSDEGCARSHSANVCIQYQRSIITESNKNWLASLWPQAKIDNLQLAHGGWADPLDEYVVPSTNYFGSLPGTLFASGHTHVPCVWTNANKIYCNPGSVGQPRDGDPRASFAVFNGISFALHRVQYDVAKTQAKMQAAGFAPYFSDNLTLGTRIGGKIDTFQALD